MTVTPSLHRGQAIPSKRVAVIGAGVGGLAAAAMLARQGLDVTVFEQAAAPGGKMRQVDGVDAGPTVFTMRWVFEALFSDCGGRLEDAVGLTPAGILARHCWGADRLDLHADLDRSAAEIAAFAGPAEARGFHAFCAAARRIYQTLEGPFIKGERPSMASLALSVRRPADLLAIKPFATLWSELGSHFRDPRLRQLFGRYATYCGSSPFLAPATLMLVADVEQQGVWYVEGGMHALAQALAGLAAANGAVIRYGAAVCEIAVQAGRVSGVRLASGEAVAAEAVIANADPQAIAAGLFGQAVQGAVVRQKPAERSLSALTWTGIAEAEGFPLVRHNVFFSGDYKAEFDALGRGAMAREPTVYVCAQDRADDPVGTRPERLLILINAPATGSTLGEIDRYKEDAWGVMKRCGLTLTNAALTATGPAEFERLFPATGGALYGPAVHGATASFKRPASRTAVRGLYLAGGAAHPGAGVPMAALSGRLAASALMADLGSDLAKTGRSRMTATAGGMSTR